MGKQDTKVRINIRLSEEQAKNLSHFARAKSLSEEQVIEKALDILFSLADIFDTQVERQGWSFLSEPSLQRVWDNSEDANYDKSFTNCPGNLNPI